METSSSYNDKSHDIQQWVTRLKECRFQSIFDSPSPTRCSEIWYSVCVRCNSVNESNNLRTPLPFWSSSSSWATTTPTFLSWKLPETFVILSHLTYLKPLKSVYYQSAATENFCFYITGKCTLSAPETYTLKLKRDVWFLTKTCGHEIAQAHQPVISGTGGFLNPKSRSLQWYDFLVII